VRKKDRCQRNSALVMRKEDEVSVTLHALWQSLQNPSIENNGKAISAMHLSPLSAMHTRFAHDAIFGRSAYSTMLVGYDVLLSGGIKHWCLGGSAYCTCTD